MKSSKRTLISAFAAILLITACGDDSSDNHGNSTDVSVCTENTCGGHGKCAVTLDNSAVCICDNGYHTEPSNADNCVLDSEEPNACKDITCGGHGKCAVTQEGTAVCICDYGYHTDPENDANCVKNYEVDDTIVFGHYEQDNDTTNGKEPIEWRVLGKNGFGQYLIISEKVLDVMPYNMTYIPITWEKSTIRSWLNGYGASYNTVGNDYTSNNFIDTAFIAEEKALIVTSSVPAHSNPNYNTDPGNATTDKIFLLSIVEANKYFASDSDRQAMATLYAIKNGVPAFNYDISGEFISLLFSPVP